MSKRETVLNISLPIVPLTLLLFVLKLTDTINIPWLLVFMPMWIPFALFGSILAGMLLLALISAVLNVARTYK